MVTTDSIRAYVRHYLPPDHEYILLYFPFTICNYEMFKNHGAQYKGY